MNGLVFRVHIGNRDNIPVPFFVSREVGKATNNAFFCITFFLAKALRRV